MSETAPQKSEDLEVSARRRVERWLLSAELREYMQCAADPKCTPLEIGPYITISRQSGTGGDRIARMVGHELGWDVLGKELLDFITQRYGLPRKALDLLDETKANWVRDHLVTSFDPRAVRQDEFVQGLKKVLLLAAVTGKIVIVGRGAHCLLPRERGLAVRLIAPRDFRIGYVMQQRSVDRKQADRLIDEVEAGRQAFSRRYFNEDISDPGLFDLMINLERISPEVAATQIVQAYRQTYETEDQ